jgi:hypothetical protein
MSRKRGQKKRCIRDKEQNQRDNKPPNNNKDRPLEVASNLNPES